MGALHVTSWEVMQRDSDIDDNGKSRIVLYCVKRSTSKFVAVLPHVGKSTVNVRL